MKTKLLSLLLSLVLLLAFAAACFGGTPDGDNGQADNEQAENQTPADDSLQDETETEGETFLAAEPRRPFGQFTDTGEHRILPDNRTQDEMNLDIIAQFASILPNFHVEPNTASDKENFRMVLKNPGGTGGGIAVCESQGFGMIMAAYLAGAEDMDIGNNETLRARLLSNLPDELGSQFAPGEITLRHYFDAMFRTMRGFPADNYTPCSFEGPRYLMHWNIGEIDGDFVNHIEFGGVSTATDGALDMTYALLLADAQWGGEPHGQTNEQSGATAEDSKYLYWAKGAINEIRITNVNHIFPDEENPLMNLTVGNWAGWNENNLRITRPSDFMLTHLRSFAETGTELNRTEWNAILDTTFHAANQAAHPITGFLPDFLWFGGDGDWRPKGANEDGLDHFNESERDHLYGWNACRVPLRLGLDVLRNGEDSPIFQTAQRMNSSMRQSPSVSGEFSRIHGGELDGTFPGEWMFTGNAFAAPYLVLAAAFGPVEWLTNGWDYARNFQITDTNFYGDYIMILSMIASSGNWWTP